MPVHTSVEVRRHLQLLLLRCHPLSFFEMVSLWPRSHQLASPSVGIICTGHHAWHFYIGSGDWTEVLAFTPYCLHASTRWLSRLCVMENVPLFTATTKVWPMTMQVMKGCAMDWATSHSHLPFFLLSLCLSKTMQLRLQLICFKTKFSQILFVCIFSWFWVTLSWILLTVSWASQVLRLQVCIPTPSELF